MPLETGLVERTDRPRYQTYLLRLWQERPDGPWRVMLQEVQGDRQWGFSDMAQCFDFIQQRLHKELTERASP